MAQYDPKSGKLRPTWTVRFTPWTVFAGCLIGGSVTGILLGLTFLLPLVAEAPPGVELPGELQDTAEVLRAAILALGGSIGIFLLLGPTLAWGLGFALRQITNQSVHVLAFAGLGLIVGFMVGDIVGRFAGTEGFGAFVAPYVGIGAAAGRWSISRYARI